MKFLLTAITKDGEQYKETLEANDRFAAYREVRTRGDRVVELKEQSDGTLAKFLFSGGALSGISLDEKVMFARNLAAMLEAGLTISRALSVVERQTSNRRLKEIVSLLSAAVKRGDTFSAALSGFEGIFSPLFVSMVHAGEESGKLAESLRVVAIQMQRASSLTKQIRGSLI